MSDSDDEPPLIILRTKNELPEDQIPIEELPTITDQHKLDLIGVIDHIVDNIVVIHSLMDTKPVDIDSILCLENRFVLGRVEEVFGPVANPYYSIRLKPDRKQGLEKGMKVYYVLELSQYVEPEKIYFKGSDASSKFDEEPPPEEIEYSDDEEEKKERLKLKKKRKRPKAKGREAPKLPPQVFSSTNHAPPHNQFVQLQLQPPITTNVYHQYPSIQRNPQPLPNQNVYQQPSQFLINPNQNIYQQPQPVFDLNQSVYIDEETLNNRYNQQKEEQQSFQDLFGTPPPLIPTTTTSTLTTTSSNPQSNSNNNQNPSSST